MNRSFLLDLEEMSKAFSDLQALKWFKNRVLRGTPGPVECGGRIPERVGPLLYTPREGAGCTGMMETSAPEWEARGHLVVLCPLLDNCTQETAVGRQPLSIISAL